MRADCLLITHSLSLLFIQISFFLLLLSCRTCCTDGEHKLPPFHSRKDWIFWEEHAWKTKVDQKEYTFASHSFLSFLSTCRRLSDERKGKWKGTNFIVHSATTVKAVTTYDAETQSALLDGKKIEANAFSLFFSISQSPTQRKQSEKVMHDDALCHSAVKTKIPPSPLWH